MAIHFRRIKQRPGEVIFERAAGNRGALVTVLQAFRMGKLASLWETLTGRDPKEIENLRHFKAFAETGEIPRVQRLQHVGNPARVCASQTTCLSTRPRCLSRFVRSGNP